MKAARLLAAAAACLVLDAAAFDVGSLFAMLARERPPRAQFAEKKYMALLDKPLEASGELAFTPPHTIEKRTLKPRPERVVVDRERVTLERGGKTHTLSLREHPQVAVLVESIRATLAGDLDALSRTYSVGLEGDERSWRLRMRPLDPALTALVDRIEIAGSGALVKVVEIHQSDGDRSVMTLAPVAR
ncbi:MAG TPA: LolA-related protein [Usitatibacter sp.]|nr:LolA-related protein [Usitatibacter sp.]